MNDLVGSEAFPELAFLKISGAVSVKLLEGIRYRRTLMSGKDVQKNFGKEVL